MKIVENRKWRFTNIGFLNDGREFVHAWQMAREIIPELWDYSLDDAWLPWWVTCFSKLHDNFSQWGLYGDKGAGVAIGLNPSYLGNSIVRLGETGGHLHHFWTEEVVYQRQVQIELISKLVASLDSVQDREFTLATEISKLAVKFKQAEFFSEEEVRCVQFYPTEGEGMLVADDYREFSKPYLKFANKSGRLVPFLELDLTHPNLISKIVTGPRFDQGSNIFMLKNCLRFHGLDSIEVVPSSILYGT